MHVITVAIIYQPKPKERRRGKKEIHRDNQDTLRFYLRFSLAGTVSITQLLCVAAVTLYIVFNAGTTDSSLTLLSLCDPNYFTV